MAEVVTEQYEDTIYQLIQEYLKKNRYIQLNEIIPFVKARLARTDANINELGIIKVIQSFVKRKIIVEGSKLLREDILTVPKRKRLYEFIIEHPGIYFNRVLQELEYGRHEARWHLSMLLLFDFIKKIKIDKHEAYFDSELNPDNLKALYYIGHIKSKMILGYLKTNTQGTTKNQLSTVLGLHPGTVLKYIEKLEEVGLLSKKEESKPTLYYLKEEYYNNLINN